MVSVVGAISLAPFQPHQTVETLANASPIVERMQQRLETLHSAALSEEILTQKQQLQQQALTIHFIVDSPNAAPADVQISLAEHPDWIVFNVATSSFVVDEQSVRFFLDNPTNALFQRPTNVIAYPMSHDAMRVAIQGKAQSGYTFDIHSTSQKIVNAFTNKQTSIDIPLSFQQGTMLLVTSKGVQELTRLSMGISDYEKSPSGRAANIEKALDEQLHGIAIQPNDSFSFNEAMRGSTGWEDALVIKRGGALVAEPGGGICQAATTVFRAALLAGLPITKRANHSLYVHYYEKYGVGLDATVYSGKQDFTFHNDTNAPLIFSARNEGSKAIVELYGKSDGRTVQLEGPFFSTSNDGFEKKLSMKQIGWQYDVEYVDGRKVQKQLISTYTMLPKAIRGEYADAGGIGLLSDFVKKLDTEKVTMR